MTHYVQMSGFDPDSNRGKKEMHPHILSEVFADSNPNLNPNHHPPPPPS